MKPQPECLRCILTTRLREIEYSTLSPTAKVALAKKLLVKLVDEFTLESTELSMLASRVFEDLVAEAPDIVDYYRLIKARSMRIALSNVEVHRKHAERLGDYERLHYLLKLSALGNLIDYGVAEHVFEEHIEPSMVEKAEPAIDDSHRLYELVERRGLRVLFLLDNAGEAVYDSLLAEYMRGKGSMVIGVAKDEPGFQNDVTLSDLLASGLDKAFDMVITPGCRGVCSSIHLEKTSEDFRRLLGSVDLIIAKGMAHFEYLYEAGIGKPVLFILTPKCNPVAAALGSRLYRGKPVIYLWSG
ncbi:damage-control phosphatase ARMT1 family protein [Desulfurococcus mucosus]|uniref:Damage-control phosphatase ARMT1-like metal-binding domain-containing protein n=1 Tax=Desulfurococcus mucosus (strain ATCC 35584 / DSM 2162 / JCM 9187 / O7/1) TaxID=765177 RepID=E8R9U3_DESM0|nr:ARMT1-like domain-containing protein [Desulfurococcus mucosus]ADV65269.1 protein of unknown function DUF89 [Desulfurococcus mucosus DSM 2162]